MRLIAPGTTLLHRADVMIAPGTALLHYANAILYVGAASSPRLVFNENQSSAPVMMHGIAAHPVAALPGRFAMALQFIIAFNLVFREQLSCTNVGQQMS
jgi:hypothetical protein